MRLSSYGPLSPSGLLPESILSIWRVRFILIFPDLSFLSLLPPPFHLSFSYLTLQETPGIQDILCPRRKEEGGREGRGSVWGGGVGCRGDKARGSTLLAFNKRHPQRFPYTYTRSSQTPPGSRKGWSWGWWGGVELEEGEIKETHPTIAVRPPSTPFLVFSGFLARPESPFSHGERRKTLLFIAPPPLSVLGLLNLTLASCGGTWFIVLLTCSALLLHVLALVAAKIRMALELCHILLVSQDNSILLQLGL